MDAAALEALAESIRAQGVIQPLVVRPVGYGRYELIAGERRWRASQLAGLAEVPAVVRTVPDETALAMALIENIQREDLNPLEEALGLKRLADEFGMTHEAVAAAVGPLAQLVSNLLRLLSLAEPVQALVNDGKLDMGHARALLTCRCCSKSVWRRTLRNEACRCATPSSAPSSSCIRRRRAVRRRPIRTCCAWRKRCQKRWAPRSASGLGKRAAASWWSNMRL